MISLRHDSVVALRQNRVPIAPGRFFGKWRKANLVSPYGNRTDNQELLSQRSVFDEDVISRGSADNQVFYGQLPRDLRLRPSARVLALPPGAPFALWVLRRWSNGSGGSLWRVAKKSEGESAALRADSIQTPVVPIPFRMFRPSYKLTPRILRQLKAIERTCGFLSAVRLQPEWIQEVRSETYVREALASVQIEGNSLTLEQAFELAEELPARNLRDSEREFCNYLQAFQAIEPLHGVREERITKGDLLNLHRTLVSGVRGGHRGAGELRREQVRVGDIVDGETIIHHQPPAWTIVEEEIESLLEWVEAGKDKRDDDDPWIHPVIQAGIAQHRPVWIHPFLDGNGRSARMFTTMLLYQRRYDFKYLFDLSSYYNEDRDEYYKALRTADATGDYTEWLLYFLGGFARDMVDIKLKAEEQAA